MFPEAPYVILGFLMYFPAGNKVRGRGASICAFKGSRVEVPCPAANPNASVKWYSVYNNGRVEVLHNASADGHNTLTITSLNESNAKSYCCEDESSDKDTCWGSETKLQVADLQVKVFPAAEGHTVTLTCSSSCRLPEPPLAYVWYRNGEVLYDDWSPWYRELVGSDGAVAYSCAVKGREDLRAPDVSVDSVTSACFTVTYAKGKMCSHQKKSEDEPCSITYPRELHVIMTKKSHYMTLSCNSSCVVPDAQPAYSWYWNHRLYAHCESRDMMSFLSPDFVVSCGIKGHEDLHSDEVCSGNLGCWRVNYVSRRICALEGSSVTISSKLSNLSYVASANRNWYKVNGSGEAVQVAQVADRMEYEDEQSHHTLRITHVKKNDSGEYSFKLWYSLSLDFPRVLLVVTGLKVTTSPSASVTEGQRVTLTCTTSCPLKNNTIFLWYMNGRPLTLTQNHNKHLLLDPVSLENAGNYSCGVMSSEGHVSSAGESLTVKAGDKSLIINAVRLSVVILMLTATSVLYLWMRMKKKRTSTNKMKDKVQSSQMDSLYESIALRPMSPGRELQEDLE